MAEIEPCADELPSCARLDSRGRLSPRKFNDDADVLRHTLSRSLLVLRQFLCLV